MQAIVPVALVANEIRAQKAGLKAVTIKTQDRIRLLTVTAARAVGLGRASFLVLMPNSVKMKFVFSSRGEAGKNPSFLNLIKLVAILARLSNAHLRKSKTAIAAIGWFVESVTFNSAGNAAVQLNHSRYLFHKWV